MFIKLGRWTVLATAGLAAAVSAAITAGYAYEKIPQGCRTCHEMQESYDNWRTSGAAREHEDCIQCHKAPGLSGILDAQRRGVRDVASHLSGNYTRPIVATVPTAFCTSCHAPRSLDRRHDEVPRYADRQCGECHNHAPGARFGEAEEEEHEGRGAGDEDHDD